MKQLAILLLAILAPNLSARVKVTYDEPNGRYFAASDVTKTKAQFLGKTIPLHYQLILEGNAREEQTFHLLLELPKVSPEFGRGVSFFERTGTHHRLERIMIDNWYRDGNGYTLAEALIVHDKAPVAVGVRDRKPFAPTIIFPSEQIFRETYRVKLTIDAINAMIQSVDAPKGGTSFRMTSDNGWEIQFVMKNVKALRELLTYKHP